MDKRINFTQRGTFQRGAFRGNRGRRGVQRGGPRARGHPIRGLRDSNFRIYPRGRGNNHHHQNNNGIHFSKEKLEEINNKDNNEIIQYFIDFDDLQQVFENTRFTKDMFYLMTELLMKISKINSVPASNTLYKILKNTNFNNLAKKQLAEENYYEQNYLYFILNLISLNDKLIDKFTDDLIRIKYGEISEYVDIIKTMIDKHQYKENLLLAEEVKTNMEKLTDKEKHKKLVELEQKQKERENQKYDDNNNLDSIPIDYKNRDIFLSSKDFIDNKELKIAPHLKLGSYFSYERYINSMFYLEYQDCYKDLKETINYLQLNKSINNMDKKELYQLSKEFSNIYFYLEGEIKGLDLNRDGAIITIEFRTHLYKRIKFTKRMITGSLVILTDNSFNNYLLTTVFFNPYVDKKINDNQKSNMWLPKFPYYRVKLSLININQESFAFLIKNRQHLQIFESKAYFESYIHVMKRLKELNIPDLPFKKELIDADFNDLDMMNVNSNQNYYIYNDMLLRPYQRKYPIEFINLFDNSQLLAIHQSLINKIALIQGPPGTGKTHVGTILTNILLQNMNDDAQILVVCFTNHALDSFIEDILKYTNDVVRIGGRCQNEKVAEYILDNRKKYSSRIYKETAGKLDLFGENMENITSLIDSRRRVSIGDVKKNFGPLFNKVINDFFEIMNEIIQKEIKGEVKYKYNKDEIHKEIYIFWNLIDVQNKKNKPDEIVYKLLECINIQDNKKLDNLYYKIIDNFIGYDLDNLEILKKLNSSEDIEEQNKEILEINNPNKPNEEEEEEDDEEELAQNLERINYLDIDLEENKNNINLENEELYGENLGDLTKLKLLDEQKYNYLLNSQINFFKIGPTIIKLLINYMKNILLSYHLNDYNNNLTNFNDLLSQKKEILSMSDAEAIKQYKIVAMTTHIIMK